MSCGRLRTASGVSIFNTSPGGSRLGARRHQMILQELDIVDPLHERIADQVGMLGDEVEIAKILGGQRRQVELGRGKIDALAGLEAHPLLARGVDFKLRPGLPIWRPRAPPPCLRR